MADTAARRSAAVAEACAQATRRVRMRQCRRRQKRRAAGAARQPAGGAETQRQDLIVRNKLEVARACYRQAEARVPPTQPLAGLRKRQPRAARWRRRTAARETRRACRIGAAGGRVLESLARSKRELVQLAQAPPRRTHGAVPRFPC